MRVTPFDRTGLALSDELPMLTYNIGNGILKKIILFPIGLSRVLSNSMFIEAIDNTRSILTASQRLELCFIASWLNNPLRFHHVIVSLTDAAYDDKNEFAFSNHPFIDWFKFTTKE